VLWNLFAARVINPMVRIKISNCAILKGASVPVGASAWRAGTFAAKRRMEEIVATGEGFFVSPTFHVALERGRRVRDPGRCPGLVWDAPLALTAM